MGVEFGLAHLISRRIYLRHQTDGWDEGCPASLEIAADVLETVESGEEPTNVFDSAPRSRQLAHGLPLPLSARCQTFLAFRKCTLADSKPHLAPSQLAFFDRALGNTNRLLQTSNDSRKGGPRVVPKLDRTESTALPRQQGWVVLGLGWELLVAASKREEILLYGLRFLDD